MLGKANLLVIGDYNRRDYLDMFLKSRENFNFFFLEYASKKEVTNCYYKHYGEALFWGDYQHVYDLLKQINPHKVLFIFIESYYHVVLNLACKSLGIATYLVDHGIRDININQRFEINFIAQREFTSKSVTYKKITQFVPRIRAKLFLNKSVKLLPAPYATFFRQFYAVRRNNHYLETSKRITSHLRIADAYIAYSKKVYEVHQHYDYLPSEQKVYFIGIPYYDHLAKILPRRPFKKQLIMIDQGLSYRGLFGWEQDNFKKFVQDFSVVCAYHGYHLHVKLHPIQPKAEEVIWETFDNIDVIDNQDLAELLPATNLIVGFFSTYLLPLMALPFTTVVTLENHPMGRIDVSKSFVEAGVAHPVYDLEQLHEILQDVEALHQRQLPHKAKFTEEWMYKFDGKAGERLRDILLSDTL